jgi:hypothetical protein
MSQPHTIVGPSIPARPKRSTALIFVAKVADIWLHPIAFLRGKRHRPMSFDDLRTQGLLASTPRRPGTASGMGADEQVPEVQETRISMVR